ncbi:M91 family zinc metallopeptidase [Stackebrandtia nassauensis]|uniref:Hemolysin-type calcium-binding region n=1 Tax=Stackebrandtia nassauensis (strain DSM 44728 / CIP 108903 / NRRL B-16338 / NBRC 102104 / LLR-40K-21) TaxID=446470 RepID=D3Q310_STANL|nr:M91 family zinc metallopeptidase [Stackebrandtia nassauensis]ADD39980.1 Hemolysin-type calcium-binding region [Stackebrandtia nassauensis DSM 44728]
MVEPKINVDSQWFDLKADPTKLEKSATKWRAMGKKGDDVSGDLHDAANVVLDGKGKEWKGDTRDSFETHKTSLVKAVAGTKTPSDDVAGALDGLATLLRNRQGDLDALKTKLLGRVANVVNGGQITFSPKDAKETKGVMDAVAAARGIRDGLDIQMGTHTSAMSKAVGEWQAISTKWSKYASENAPDTFKLPPEADNGTQVLKLPDGSVIVNTGTGDEKTDVRTDSDGNVIVTVDGKEYKYPPGTPVAIRGGEGDDEVTINPSVKSDVTVLGGEGKDQIVDNGLPGQDPSTGPRTIIGGDGDDRIVVNGENKNISSGAGNDKVTAMGDNNNVSTGDGKDNVETTGGYNSTGRGGDFVRAGNHNDNPFLKGMDVHESTTFGGTGDDEIQGSTKDDKISAGSGDDQVYGHEGDDLVDGGAGHDYLDGQDGDDNISGGADKDTVYGLDGDDTLTGGSGRDYLEGAEGNDTIGGGTEEDVVSGGRGDDNLHGDDGDDVMYAGAGKDTLDGGEGNDKQFVQDEDKVASDGVAPGMWGVNDSDTVQKVDIVDNSYIQVRGSDEFQDRIRADLDMYSSSPTGKQMMENLGDRVSDTHDDWKPGEREVVIKEFDEENGTASSGKLSGSDVEIQINPDFHLDDPGEATTSKTEREGVPSAILYHELAHGYDYLNDTSADGHDKGNDAPNDERQAAGLDYDWTGDGKRDNVHDKDNPHPYAYTENGLRDEMGRDHRDAY